MEIENANRILFKKMKEIELKPIADHLNPFLDLEEQKPNHIQVGKIRYK